MSEKPKYNAGERQRKVDALAADIYARMIASGRALQVQADKIAEEARQSAEAFYPDESPAPSVPMTKEV